MLETLGGEASALGVARPLRARYPGLVDVFVVDDSDVELAQPIRDLGAQVQVTPTVMRTDDDRRQLARAILEPPTGDRAGSGDPSAIER